MELNSFQHLLDDGSLIAMDADFRRGEIVGEGTPYDQGFGLRISDHSVVFTGAGGEFVARAHFVGSIAEGLGSWMWGWNNVNGFPDEVVARARAIKVLGEQYGIAELTVAEQPLTAELGETAQRYSTVATLLSDRMPSYIANLGGGTIAVFLVEHPEFVLPPLSTPRLVTVLQATAAEGRVHDWRRAIGQYAAFRGLTVTPQPDGLTLSGPTVDEVKLKLDADSRLTGISGTAQR